MKSYIQRLVNKDNYTEEEEEPEVQIVPRNNLQFVDQKPIIQEKTNQKPINWVITVPKTDQRKQEAIK